MIVKASLLTIALLVGAAQADTLRLKVRPSSGELAQTPTPCGKAVQAEVWRIVFKKLYIEIIDNKMTVAFADRSKSPDRHVASGDSFVGFYDYDDETIAISVYPKRTNAAGTLVLTEITVINRNSKTDVCGEKWQGSSEKL